MTHFVTDEGVTVGAHSADELRAAFTEMERRFTLRPAQIVEAAALSMGMVVRHALGLSALSGNVVVMADDSLAGWIALAAGRHLVSSGATLKVVLFLDPAEVSAEGTAQLTPLQESGVVLDHWSMHTEADAIGKLFDDAHNTLCGLYHLEALPRDEVLHYMQIMNELSTPVHTVIGPPGLDPQTGTPDSKTLIASSCLSLGAPLSALVGRKDYLGRHYLCDVSLPRAQRDTWGDSPPTLFASQPVVRVRESA